MQPAKITSDDIDRIIQKGKQETDTLNASLEAYFTIIILFIVIIWCCLGGLVVRLSQGVVGLHPFDATCLLIERERASAAFVTYVS